MKAAVLAFALGTMITVEQRDRHRSLYDPLSAAISTDGRLVAFTTYSRLVSADTNDLSDVYVLDRARLDVTLESAGGSTGDTSNPGISGDGRYVVFERSALVMLRDRREAATTVIGRGRQPSITADGSHILFTAGTFESASGADVNGWRDDVSSIEWPSGRARRVSIGMGSDEPMTASVRPSASRDGRYVAFTSRLQPGDERSRAARIFVSDKERGVTSVVGDGWDPSISGDGRFVAFVGVSSGLPHIFLADLHAGDTRIITTSVRRGLANGASAKPMLSADGRYVVFQSEASDLDGTEDFNLLWDVFVFDRMSNTTTRVSGDPDEVWMAPSGGPAIDGDGSTVVFSSRHPTDVSDKRNDLDLYVAATPEPSQTVKRSPPSPR